MAAPHALPQGLRIDQATLLSRIAPTMLQGSADRAAAYGHRARYLLLDRAASPQAAVDAFARGEGKDFPTDAAPDLREDQLFRQHQVVYILSALQTREKTASLRVPCLEISRATAWVGDLPTQMHAIADGGDDLPAQLGSHAIPVVFLNPPASAPVPILLRLEAVVSIYPAIFYEGREAFETYLTRQVVNVGGMIGATLTACAVALFAVFRRRTWGVAFYFLAMLDLGIWNAARLSPIAVSVSPIIRRALLPAPLFGYFILAAAVIGYLLRDPRLPGSTDRRTAVRWVDHALLAALVLNLLGLLAALDYGVRGADALLAAHLQAIQDLSSLISPVILFTAVLTRAHDRLPGYPYLLASQLAMVLGFAIYLVREYTTWFAYTPWMGILSTWSLPLEAVLWAFALSTRYRYLDALAKDKMLGLLQAEEQRIRREIALSNVSRDRALAELNTHYQSLRMTHDALLAIFDGSTHACRGIAQKLAITIQRQARKSGDEAPWRQASDMLAALMSEVETLSTSAISAVDMPTPAGAPDDYLRWQLSIFDNEWRMRGLAANLGIGPDVAALIVDGTAYAIVVREMLSNATRYAAPRSTVDIRLVKLGGCLQLSVENDGTPDAARMADIGSARLSPAPTTYNEESSTGHGLYTTSRLLANRGGSLKAETVNDRRFRLTAWFPLLDREVTETSIRPAVHPSKEMN